MPISPNSPCPGGTGNKIKFCCSTLLGELEKIDRMLEGEQYQACLMHIEHLEKTHPDKACLLATKTLLLRALERAEEAQTTTAAFLEKHPNNPIALAEAALLAAVAHESRRAVELLLRALTASDGRLHPRVYLAMDSISRLLAADGQLLAARALIMLQLHIEKRDRRAIEFLMQLNVSPSIPLVLKEERIFHRCRDGVPWKAEFDEVESLAMKARWAEAAERLAELAQRVDGEPVIWRNLATLRGWLADTPGCLQALRKLAALVPLEEAVETEALALFLSDDPLGDHLDLLTLRYTVREVELLEAGLSSAPRAVQMRADLGPTAAEDVPPPKAVFLLFDRVSPEPGTEITAQTTPRMLCQALLYGRQTDRDAQLEVIDVLASDLDQVKALLDEAAGDALGSEPQQEVTETASATQQLLNFSWRLPAHATREDVQRLTLQCVENAILQTWPQARLGLLDGKCPQEAADQEPCRVRLLAAIMVLEFWLEETGGRFDFNRLRSRLGLPALEPIDPEQTALEDLPLVRWSRVVVEKLSDDALLEGYRRAMVFNLRAALGNLAQAVVERPGLSTCNERVMAFEMMARMVDDSDQALRYVDEGRKAARQAGQSCARWDLLELPFRLERGESEEMSRLLDHLQSQHINEPGVARALTGLLVEAGLLRPDGAPAGPRGAPAAQEPSLVIPGQSTAEPGKLWTPESQKPTGEKPKIWTPGMD